MATTTMERQERLERGEKFLVFAVMSVFGIESIFTIVAAGRHFSPLGLIWGAGSALFMLILANYLYAGSKAAQKVGAVWSAFQICLSLVILLTLVFSPGAADKTAHLALPLWWMAAVKLLGYVILSLALVMAPRVKDFLDVKGGAELEPEMPLAPTGIEVTFADDQKEVIASLGRLFTTAGVVLIIIGFLQALISLRELIEIAKGDSATAMQALALWLFIRFLPAVATVSIGILMFQPSGAAKLIRTQGTDLSYIVNALIKLRGFFYCLAILIGIQVVGALLGVPLF